MVHVQTVRLSTRNRELLLAQLLLVQVPSFDTINFEGLLLITVGLVM